MLNANWIAWLNCKLLNCGEMCLPKSESHNGRMISTLFKETRYQQPYLFGISGTGAGNKDNNSQCIGTAQRNREYDQ